MLWRMIAEFQDYEVSENGDVRRRRSGRGTLAGRVLCPYIEKKRGYQQVALCRDGRAFTVRVHRLVAIAFLGPPPFAGAEVAHGDGIGSNCHLSNLRWDSPRGNTADKFRHGTNPAGERNPRAKLDFMRVLGIRLALQEGRLLHREIAEIYGVRRQAISKILLNQRWA